MKSSSLNHTYRLIWSAATQTLVVGSELTKAKGKIKAVKCMVGLATLLALPLPQMGYADVTGGVVTSGTGVIEQSGQVTHVTQQSQTLNLNWNTFNIDKGQTVNFIQPNSRALAVNMILDTNGSRVLGHLNANGQVWLINPNGVFFGQGAQVNVGSILASTLNPLSASGANTQLFGNGGTGSVVNQGSIQAASGGYVAFIANTVSNQGSIVANNGTVALAGGSQVTLSFADNQLFKINVDQSSINSLVENKQIIQANGGTVLLSAGAKQSLIQSVVNNTGVIEAQTIENKAGKIVLMAGLSAGTTNVSGTLDASAAQGNGGFIETSGATVNVSDSAIVTTKALSGQTGTWLIDPLDFTIATAGGNITGAAIGTALASNHVRIETADATTTCTGVAGCSTGTAGNGDIFVNDFITWGSDKTLTLSAYRNIYINRTMTANNSNGKLALEFGQGSDDGTIDGTVANYYIHAPVNLKAGSNFSTKLGADALIRPVIYTVITDLGQETSVSDGTLQAMNTQGNYVLGANIDASATENWNGGQGFTPIGLNNSFGFIGNFDGLGHVIDKLYINRPETNSVGLFSVLDVLSDGFVLAGLVQNVGLTNASISGNNSVGGLAGLNKGTISGSFVNGSVQGIFAVGGLVGENGGLIDNSYAKGTVTASDGVGGLVGQNYTNYYESVIPGTINNGYADVAITMIEPCVTGCSFIDSPNKGGLVGANIGWDQTEGTVNNSYWNKETEATDNGVGSGLTKQQMQTTATFDQWDIDAKGGTGKVWRIYAGHTEPLLRSFMTYTDLGTVQTTYNGAQQSPPPTIIAGLNPAWVNGTAAFGTNAGTYTNSDYYSSQLGYDFDRGDLQINKAAATVTANSDTVTYNGAVQSVTGFKVKGLVGDDTENALNISTSGGTGTNAGSYTHMVSGTAQNYVLAFVDGALTIKKAAATVTANSDTVTYNGGVQSVTGFQVKDLVGNDTASVLNVTTSGGSGTNAGVYTHTASGTAQNYILTFVDGALTIKKAAATVTANSDTVTYNGGVQSVQGFQVKDLVGNDTASALNVTTSGGTGTNAGDYKHMASGTAQNYILTFVDGALTIKKAAATVTANSDTVTYNGAVQSVTGFKVKGLVGDDTESALNVTTSGGSGTNAGDYKHTASGTAQNYVLTFVDGALTIKKAAATVTANSDTVTYNGSTQSVTGVKVVGLVGDDREDVLAVYTTGGSGVDAGVYPHQVFQYEQEGVSNYQLTLVDGALTIQKSNTTLPPDLTNPIANTRNPVTPPPAAPNTIPPITTLNLNITPSSGPEDDVLYDVIETFGCSV